MAATAGVIGLNVTLIALQKSTMTVQDALPFAVQAGGRAYAAKVKQAITRRDHTLAQLAALDHPYARRHGRIRIHPSEPWVVHRQSGKMARAFTHYAIGSPSSPAYEVTFDYGAAPHAKDVILGTQVMLGRDVLWAVAQRPETQRAMMREIVRELGAKMRTKLGVRFGAGAPSGSSLGIR